MKKIILFLLFAILAKTSTAQILSGVVVDEKGEAIVSAEVLWLGTTVGTVTNLDGEFILGVVEGNNQLVFRYLSYKTDTIEVNNFQKKIRHTMYEDDIMMEDINLQARSAATISSRITAVQVQTITGEELCKAACCNLSESFETNASVDVAYSDAATGAKQIRMLGLQGTYVQLLTEGAPNVRGLAQNYGMEYIPGVWMESIQVSKGTSSVLNGYEATTGQINVEYLKPQTADPIAINAMVASSLRTEINATGGWNLNDYVSTAVMAHYKNESLEHDSNGDGFNDLPQSNHGNLLNRWYIKKGDYTGQIMLKGLYDERRGGQLTKKLHPDQLASQNGERYHIGIDTWRVEGMMKNGYVFDKEKGTSIGVIMSGSYHDQEAIFGRRFHDGGQANFYINAIFQTNFTDAHKLVTGLSANYDKYFEKLHFDNDPSMGSQIIDFDREEVTPGVFAEYSYKYSDKLSLLLGLRADWSSRFGVFVTPRLNVRYSPWSWWNVRASVGMGYRSPNMLSDNSFVMPTSRALQMRNSKGEVVALNNDHFKQEKALNAGISTTFYIPIAGRELQITGEYYYTNFFENVVVDMDSDPHSIIFSNLNGGRSYAGNAQIEASMEILKGWTMTAAFRHTDVKTTVNGKLVEKPLTNRYKGLITTSYVTPLKRWQFDVTAQLNGGGRMPTPYTTATGEQSWSNEFNAFPQLMAQVTKYFRTWSIYLGAENITNFKQKNPVIAADRPFSTDFDASMAWGPIHGAKVYVGFRWAIDRE